MTFMFSKGKKVNVIVIKVALQITVDSSYEHKVVY